MRERKRERESKRIIKSIYLKKKTKFTISTAYFVNFIFETTFARLRLHNTGLSTQLFVTGPKTSATL